MKRIIIITLLFAANLAYAIHLPTIELKDSTRVGIILIGDTGEPGAHQAEVAKAIEKYCAKELCSFGLLLGDNIYPSGPTGVKDKQFKEKFEDPYKNLKFKFYPVLGNHDEQGDWEAEVKYQSKHWQMGGRYYTLYNQWLELIALDTNLYWRYNYAKPDPDAVKQLQWLKDELSESKANWKIVYAHAPLYSNGENGNDRNLQFLLQPILEKNHVQFYISGHDHDLELIDVNGVHYIVSGSGSHPVKFMPGANSIFAHNGTGFTYLLLTPEEAVLRFIDGNAKVLFEIQYSIKQQIKTKISH